MSTRDLVTSVKCSATSKRTHERCGQWAIAGGTVCKWHGGGAPQVIAKAQERLRALFEDKGVQRITEALDAEAAIVVSDGAQVGAHIEYVPDVRERRTTAFALGDRVGFGPTKRTELVGADGEGVKLVIGIDPEAV